MTTTREGMMKFTETHEWVSLDGDIATIGVSEHAQQELGDIVYVELPEVGATVTAGQEIVVLESTKAAADVYSPVTGSVSEVNEALDSQPEMVTASAEGSGWLVKVKVSTPEEIDALMSREQYRKSIG